MTVACCHIHATPQLPCLLEHPSESPSPEDRRDRPRPRLDDGLRGSVIDAAVRFANHVGYTNLGMFEFLVERRGLLTETSGLAIDEGPEYSTLHHCTLNHRYWRSRVTS